jgi:mannosyltransferase OCH1-like enzyme
MGDTQRITLLGRGQDIWEVTLEDTHGVKAVVKVLASGANEAVTLACRHLSEKGMPNDEISACTATVQPHDGSPILSTIMRAYVVKE